MCFKKIAILALFLLVMFQATLPAQEKEPLVMQIFTEWTLAGAMTGIAVGGAVWLTDPGRPGNKLSDQIVSGAAWGAVAGAFFSLYILNETMIPPVSLALAPHPLHPSQRITGDLVVQEEKGENLLAYLGQNRKGRDEFIMPLLYLNF